MLNTPPAPTKTKPNMVPMTFPRTAPASTSYHVEVIRTAEAFSQLKSAWDAIVHDTGETSINVDHGWLSAWLKHFAPRSAHVITVRNDEKELIAAAPFKIVRPRAGLNRRLLRHVQFIGTEPCLFDEMKILIKPGHHQEAVLDQIAGHLMKNKGEWDVLDLRYNPDDEQLVTLMRLMGPVTYQGEIEETMSCPYFTLPNDHAAYEQQLPKNRKKLKRHKNQLARDFEGQEYHLTFITSPDQVEHHLDDLIQRHVRYWGGRGVTSGFTKFPALKAFYMDLLEKYALHDNPAQRRIHFSAVTMGDDVLSYDIGLQQKDGYLGHLGCYCESYKRYGPGFIHTESLIQNAIEQGDARFYFGRGNEGHKSNWADQAQSLHNLLLFNSRRAYLQWQADVWLKKVLKK